MSFIALATFGQFSATSMPFTALAMDLVGPPLGMLGSDQAPRTHWGLPAHKHQDEQSPFVALPDAGPWRRQAGQALALRKIKAGVDGMSIHKGIQDLFGKRGYPTEERKGRRVGFFHGTGHGLGLEIHEYPRLQKVTLKAGQVVTVEPGLYYPGLGGVRLEDVVIVTRTGHKMLSRFPKQLEI